MDVNTNSDAQFLRLLEVLGESINRPRRNYTNSRISVDRPPIPKNVKCAQVGRKCQEERVLMVPVNVSSGQEIYSPYGTTATEHLNYHEVCVPAVDPITEKRLRELTSEAIPITAVKLEHRTVFSDLFEFNAIQSIAFDVAYKTDENMLVCAPTGSGKTLIAVLSILRELHHYSNIDEFRKSPFKVVYVAPMKALAAQIAENFKKRLEPLGISVREFTGDMHLYADEISETGILVTTPEKYDTVTRRNTGSKSLFQNVKLLIIDEVHVLHGDRGPVLEAIVARTFQLGQVRNERLRVIGLSATLPNYEEIADFLHVKHDIGLFYFNWGFRPVPLAQTFIGSKWNRSKKHWDIRDEICYEKVLSFVKRNQQVIIFVHSRAQTIGTASFLEKKAEEDGEAYHFRHMRNSIYYEAMDEFKGSKLNKLRKLVEAGLGFHHAGMLREDRQKVEKLFAIGIVRVLVSTATLAWGVNFPAHAVIIKGTRMYSPSKGSTVNIELLDVQQMFGRAGRPQFDSTGEAIIIADQADLPYYLSLLTWHMPIKSHMIDSLCDHLNAEIVLGTVSNIEDGVRWLNHTFLYICMMNRPEHYDVTGSNVEQRCRELITTTAAKLHEASMIHFDVRSRTFARTDIGQIASYTYIMHQTIKIISDNISNCLEYGKILELLSKAKEFEQTKQRPEEAKELSLLANAYGHFYKTIPVNKVATLMQAHMARAEITDTALYLDQIFAVQNGKRILRAVFDIAVSKKLSAVARLVLTLRKCLEHGCLPTDNAICQMKNMDNHIYFMVAETKINLYRLKAMRLKELSAIVDGDEKAARRIGFWLRSVPLVDVQVTYYRTTPDIVRIELRVTPNFIWRKNISQDEVEPFIAWVENPFAGSMYRPQQFNIHRGQAERNDQLQIAINLMLDEGDPTVPEHLVLHVESQRWLGIAFERKLERRELMKQTGAVATFSMVDEVDLNQYGDGESASGQTDEESENWDDVESLEAGVGKLTV